MSWLEVALILGIVAGMVILRMLASGQHLWG